MAWGMYTELEVCDNTDKVTDMGMYIYVACMKHAIVVYMRLRIVHHNACSKVTSREKVGATQTAPLLIAMYYAKRRLTLLMFCILLPARESKPRPLRHTVGAGF